MAITISPLYPVAGETVTLTIGNPTGNVAGYHVDSSPERSDIGTGFLSQRVETGARVDSAQDDAPSLRAFDVSELQSMIDGEALTDELVADVSGEYEITAYELREVVGIPSYPGDPVGDINKTLVVKQTTTIYVGETMDLPLLTADGDGADLRLQVNSGTVRAASLVNHRTNNALVAAKQTKVTDVLALCVGVTVSAVGTDLLEAVNDLEDQVVAHFAEGVTIHQVADTWNTLSSSTASDIQGAITLLNDIKDTLAAHLLESSQSGHAWHYNGLDDMENHPLTADAVTVADATVLCADLRWRSFERHLDAATTPLQNPQVHSTPDATNNLTVAASEIDDVVVEFFDALISTANTAKDAENQGEVDLRALYGFAR